MRTLIARIRLTLEFRRYFGLREAWRTAKWTLNVEARMDAIDELRAMLDRPMWDWRADEVDRVWSS